MKWLDDQHRGVNDVQDGTNTGKDTYPEKSNGHTAKSVGCTTFVVAQISKPAGAKPRFGRRFLNRLAVAMPTRFHVFPSCDTALSLFCSVCHAPVSMFPAIVASGDSAKEVGQRLSIEEQMPPDKQGSHNHARSSIRCFTQSPKCDNIV
jgi:hypothetical protein